MGLGLRNLSERTEGGEAVVDRENGEQLMHVQPGVDIVLNNLPRQSHGTLYISTKQVIWLSDVDKAKGYAVHFLSISLHAVSTDPDAHPVPCLYTQIDTEADEDDSDGSDSECNVSQDLSKIREMRLIPSDPTQLDTLFEIFCECAELNPEPNDEEGEENDWVFNADQMEDEESEEEGYNCQNPANSPGQSNGNHDLARTVLELEGNIVAPNSTEAWANQDRERWIDFSNVDGLVINGGGQIDGQGSVWWNACNRMSCPRPTALFIHNCSNLQLNGTRHLNSARNHISINYCNNTKMFNLAITAPQDSPNTDGIDISYSSYILFQNSTIATGDDCIAMNNGTSNINITGITCGPGHGISIGSLGEKGAYDIVEKVYVSNCSFNGTENGLRIKTWQGGSGHVRNVSFEQITLTDTKNPIIIDQDYKDIINNENNEDKKQASAVQISGVTYRDVNGTSASKIAINLDCSSSGGCTGIFMDTINITSSSGSNIYAFCNNAHGEAFSASPKVCLSQ